MQWTGPHTEDEWDRIWIHGEWGTTSAGNAGEILQWANVSTPGFADRRISVAAANTVDRDLTGYRVFPASYHPSIAFPVVAGVLEYDVPARALSTFPTQAFPPIQAVAFGRVEATVVFPGDRESGTPLVPDTNNAGKLRPLDAGVNVLSQPDFTTTTDWIAGTGWTLGSGVASYDGTAGDGTLTQDNGDFVQDAAGTTIYRFTFTANVSAGFDGVVTIQTGPGFSASTVTLWDASTHRVGEQNLSYEFVSGTAPVGDFIISAASATTGTFVIDNLRLSTVGVQENDVALQHLVCGHLLEDWDGGAAEGNVRIMARCI